MTCVRRISLIEVGPRDGLQSEPEILPTATKVELIRRAIDAGVRAIEVASFVHPGRVPQMADAEAVVAALPPRNDVRYIGLVLNHKGFARARDAGLGEVGMAILASDTYNQRNQGVSTGESLKAWIAVARSARASGMRANVMISAAFGCPYEGGVPLARVLELVDRVMEGEPVELGLADTIGAGVPVQVTEMLQAVRERVPGLPIRCHFHNTRNTGLANAQAALDAGAASLDASIGGIGGCPFAPLATGNIPTEDLLYLLDRSGVTTGVSLERLLDASRWLAGRLGRSTPAMLPKAGMFPPPAR